MSSSGVMGLKLLVDKRANKVLFAEAGKDAVDFLCSILTLPIGTVIRLLSERGMVGCLPNLYESIESLNEDYIQPNQHKNTVLKPTAYNSTEERSLFLLTDDPTMETSETEFYRCSYSGKHNIHYHVTDTYGAVCPQCRIPSMTTEVPFVEGSTKAPPPVGAGGHGFVKGVVTYMIMDDLAVAPMSTITGITLLNKFNVKDVGSLEEKVVHLDMDKGLKLMKVSFQSKKVLTKVFLEGR